MDIYQLTATGYALAHNIYAPNNSPEWLVVQFLNQRGSATKQQILTYIPSASWHTLAKLRRKGVIQLVGRTVEV